MKYLFCILLSLALTALSPAFAGEKKGPADELERGADSISSESSEEISEEYEGEADYESDMEEEVSCQGPAITEMPAVGIYAPLLNPHQPKMSKAKMKSKSKKKQKQLAPVTETRKP